MIAIWSREDQPLKYDILRVWEMKLVEVVLLIVGANGTVTKLVQCWIGKIGVEARTELLQMAAPLGTVRTLR